MEPFVFVLVLAAAIMHASWNAIVKVAGDRFFSMAIVMGAHTVIALPMVIYYGLPSPDSWLWILLSFAIHLAYYYGVINQYRDGDLSHVYPLSRGAAPLLVAAAAYVFAGEALSPPGVIAVIIISIGILTLALPGSARQAASRHATLYAMFTACMIAGYTIVDGIGGRTDAEVIRYISWLFLLEGMPLMLLLPVLRSKAELAAEWRLNGWKSVIGGALSAAAYGLVIWAMSLTPMGLVSALRETSVIIAALIGTYVMKETLGPRRIAAACLVTIGVIVLQIAGRG